MAKRTGTLLDFEIRQGDGTFKNVTLVLNPPSAEIVKRLAEAGTFTRFAETKGEADTITASIEVAAALLSRFDKEHGSTEWLLANLEMDDLNRLVPAAFAMLQPERKEGADPNAVSP